MDTPKYFKQIANTSALMGLGVFLTVGSGILFDSRQNKYIDWRDLAMLGIVGSWMTSWALFRQRY